MKKKILFVTALFAGSLAFAQGETTSMKNKRGLEYLPQEGDWAIQFNAKPLIDFGLNALKLNANTGATAVNPSYSQGFSNVIVGKMFTSATEAWRGKIGINYRSVKTDFPAVMYGANGDQEYITTRNEKVTNIVLGFGKEWRRGHNRLQGFYGAEALLVLGSPDTTTSYEYNVDLKTANDENVPGIMATRTLGTTKSSMFGFGVRGFVGVEYFIFPKIAIGAEFGWGIGFTTGKSTTSIESYNGSEVEQIDSKGTKQSRLEIGIDDGASSVFGGSAALNLTFHF